MIPLVLLGNALLGALSLSSYGLPPLPRDRAMRWIAGTGVVSGTGVLIFRSSLGTWRGFAIGSDEAAVTGLAIACAWGLVISLDLGAARWWTGGLVAVAAAGLVGMAASQWVVPALLFGLCLFIATHLALSRASRTAGLVVAVADAGLVAVLLSDAIARDQWSVPSSVSGLLVLALLTSCAARAGLVPRMGSLGVLGTPAAALGPIAVGLSFVVVLRWVASAQPAAAAAALAIALGVVAWSVLRRKLDPAICGSWPVALCAALVLASDRVGAVAACAATIGVTAMILWPDALGRGRLARGFLVSGVAPSITFGAIATAAHDSFEHAMGGGDPSQVAAWLVFSALLPVVSASGIALGVFAARAEPAGGYHPEAVFMTWILAAASVAVGVVLDVGKVFGVLGGTPAAILLGVALLGGAAALVRTDGEATDLPPSATVFLGPPMQIGAWGDVLTVAIGVGTAVAVGWLTVQGLEVGFL